MITKSIKEKNKLKKVNLFNKSLLEKDIKNRLETLRSKPFSVREIASQLGITKRTLYRHFPELCKRIAANYLASMKKMAAEKHEEKRNEIHELIEKTIKLGLYPTRSNLEKEASRPTILREFSITKELENINLKR